MYLVALLSSKSLTHCDHWHLAPNLITYSAGTSSHAQRATTGGAQQRRLQQALSSGSTLLASLAIDPGCFRALQVSARARELLRCDTDLCNKPVLMAVPPAAASSAVTAAADSADESAAAAVESAGRMVET